MPSYHNAILFRKTNMISIGVVANKGGQGKTTTAINLAHGLSMKGKKCLLVDCDDQGHIAIAFDIQAANQKTLYHYLAFGETKPEELIIPLRNNLFGIISDETLYAGLIALQNIANDKDRISSLRKLLEEIEPQGFDYVIFDGKPGQNDLVYNIIMASNYLYIPIDVSGTDFFGLAGLGVFINAINATYRDFENDIGHWFDKLCLIPNFYRKSIIDSQRDYQALKAKYSELVTPPIRFSQALPNAPRRSQTIFEYPTTPRNNGIEDFSALVDLTLSFENGYNTEDKT